MTDRTVKPPHGTMPRMVPLLSIIALILAVVGLLRLLSGQIGLGLLLLVLACAIGPGGWSVFR